MASLREDQSGKKKDRGYKLTKLGSPVDDKHSPTYFTSLKKEKHDGVCPVQKASVPHRHSREQTYVPQGEPRILNLETIHLNL